MGGSLVCGRICIDQRWSTLFVLQLVSQYHPYDTIEANQLLSIISFIGTIVVALSLGEIASIYPTAGGWCSTFSLDLNNRD